jgi:hypothetical protein
MLVVLVAVQVRQDQGTFIKSTLSSNAYHKNTNDLIFFKIYVQTARIRITELRIWNPDPQFRSLLFISMVSY